MKGNDDAPENVTLRVAGIINESFVDGLGIRFVVFTQGCPHRCAGCHNPETHSPSGGSIVSIASLLQAMRTNPLLDGLSLSGGEPFAQAESCAILAEGAHRQGHNVWVWTGYTFEFLTKHRKEHPDWIRLLEATDILTDGPFLLEERSLSLFCRGSKNQRILDVPRSLSKDRPIWVEGMKPEE